MNHAHPVDLLLGLAGTPPPNALGSALPSGSAACEVLHGQWESLPRAISWSLWRAVLLGSAIWLVGERDWSKIVKQAVGATLTVDAFVWGWQGLTMHRGGCAPLPSGDAAKALLDGKDGGLPTTAFTMLARATLIGIGIAIGGETSTKEIVKRAAAGVALIETSVLGWMALAAKRS